jgi:hypothetical protein
LQAEEGVEKKDETLTTDIADFLLAIAVQTWEDRAARMIGG